MGAKPTALAREAAKQAREALWAYLGAALCLFSPLEGLHDCHHWGSPSS